MATSIAGAMEQMTQRAFGARTGGAMQRRRTDPLAVPPSLTGNVMPAAAPVAAPPIAAPPVAQPMAAAPSVAQFRHPPPTGGLIRDSAFGNESVESRVARISAGDSDLMRQAAQTGVNLAAKRGLGNSSMAVGSAQAEVLRAATPIATADAQFAEQDRLTRLGINSQEKMQGTDITAQRERLQIATDAEMGRLERQLASAEGQQAKDIQATMDRLRETNAAEMSRLEKQGQITGGLQGAQNAAEMQRLQASLASATEQQRVDIQARIAQLQQQAGIDTAGRTQAGLIQGQLQTQQNAAELERLRESLAGANEQQRMEITAQMERLIASGQQSLAQIGASGDQDRQRIELQGNIEKALQSSGAEQQRAFANLQGEITSKLQSQQDTGAMARLAAGFAHDVEQQKGTNDQRLKEIAASGDQEVRRMVEAGLQERENLSMSIAAGDRERVAASMISIFNAEANLRAALLSNPQMPASERAAYESAIAGMGDPIRNYINSLFSPPPAPAPAAGIAPPGSVPAPVAGAPVPAGLVQNPDLASYYGAPTPLPQVVPTPTPSGGLLQDEDLERQLRDRSYL